MRLFSSILTLALSLTLLPCAVHGSDIQTEGSFISTEPTDPPLTVASSAHISNLNADLLDGFGSATTFSSAQQIYVSGTDGKLPDGVVGDGSIEDTTRRVFFGCNQIHPGYSATPPSMGAFGITPALVFGYDVHPDQYVLLSTLVPEDWNGTSDIAIRVLSAAEHLEGNVYWYSQVVAHEDDEDLTTSSVAMGGALIAYASSTIRGLVHSTSKPLEAVNLKRRDLLSIEISRDAGMVQDTLQGDAFLLGVELTYTAAR